MSLYNYLADFILFVHFLFILFVLFGALLLFRWRKIVLLHIPAVAWAVWVQFQGGYCPLTPLENHFRNLSGESGYDTGFVEHYIGGLVYPGDIPPMMHIYLGLLVLVLNITIYAIVIRRRRLINKR